MDKQIDEMAKVIEQMPWRLEQGGGLGCKITNNTELAKYFYNAGYRKASDVARKFRQRMNEKMGKHTHLLGKEYVQRIMREIEKEISEGEG